MIERGITMQELRAFALVTKVQSFTRAAEALRLTQPGLSMAIRQLETKLGVALFDRSRRAVQLTPVGSALLPSVEKLVESFDRTIAGMVEVSEGKTGRIAIACPEGVAAQLVAPALKAFVLANPGVVVSLFDGDARSIEHMMHSRIADFGLTGFWNDNRDFVFTPLTRDRCCILCPKEHRLARKRVSLSDLEGEPLLVLNRDTGVRRLIEREAAAKGVRLEVHVEVARVATLVEISKTNRQICILTELARPRILEDGMVAVPLTGDALGYDIGIVTPAARMLTAAASSFIKAIVQTVGQSESSPSRQKDF